MRFSKFSDDQRISLIGGAVLITLTVAAGISVYSIMRQQAEAYLNRSMEVSLSARARAIDVAIQDHMLDTSALSMQAALYESLHRLESDPLAGQQMVQGLLHKAIGHEFDSLVLLNKEGKEIARAGHTPGQPQMSVLLNMPYRTQLQWDGGFVVVTQANIFRGGVHLGTLIGLRRLPDLAGGFSDLKILGDTADIVLCASEGESYIQCFPSRLSPLPTQHLARVTQGQNKSQTNPVELALQGKSGFLMQTARDGAATAAAYKPVGALGLALVLSTEADQLYQPIEKQARYIFPVLGMLIILGGLVLRWQVLPLVRKAFVSEQKARELNRKLLRNEARIRAVLDRIDEGIVSITSAGLIRTFNPAAERMFGYAAEEAVGNEISMLIPASHLQQYTDYLKEYLESGKGLGLGASREVLAKRRDGTVFPVEIKVGEVKLEGEHLFIGALRDIAERKAAEAKVAHLANHDTLTDLPNRNLLQDRARQALSQAGRQKQRVGILFIDLDQFKTINDSLGHHVGDRLLQTVAARIRGCVRDEDTVARQGGDEFIVVLPTVKRFEDVGIIAQKLLGALASPYSIDNADLHTSASIGVAVFPDDGDDVETLMRNADTAMYYAKSMGRNNFQFFTPKMNQAAAERLSVENKLRHALDRHEFSLVYQPIVNLSDGRVHAAEALLRWTSDGKSITPDRFIPVAEETGLIVPIGDWVMRAALYERRRWLDQGYILPRMFVNMSARQFAQKNLVAIVGRMLQEVDLSPEHLGIEITESLLMERPEDAVRTLKTLSSMGVEISIDDFGTGYSSLSYLKRFPLNKIKIDRSFVRDIASDPDDAAIVTAIIAMAHSLNATVVAEGVETQDQLNFLRAHGCDAFQGYLFSRPVPDQEILEYLGKTETVGVELTHVVR